MGPDAAVIVESACSIWSHLSESVGRQRSSLWTPCRQNRTAARRENDIRRPHDANGSSNWRANQRLSDTAQKDLSEAADLVETHHPGTQWLGCFEEVWVVTPLNKVVAPKLSTGLPFKAVSRSKVLVAERSL